MDLIHEQAASCLTAPAGANFENKIVLAIAIRLAAEMFMLKILMILPLPQASPPAKPKS